jgi:hypothetical protein
MLKSGGSWNIRKDGFQGQGPYKGTGSRLARQGIEWLEAALGFCPAELSAPGAARDIKAVLGGGFATP